MRALVLGGAGAVCRETTRDLALYSQFDEIVVADQNLQAVNQLLDLIGDARLSALLFDANDYQGMLQLFPTFDIVINGLPFQFDYPVNQACVACGVNGLDLSSEDPQFALHQRALEQDMIFIPGVGATPGVTNMMVRRASEQLQRMDEVEIYFAAFRCLAPAPGLLQTTLWEFNPEEEDRQEVYFEDGRWHPTPPLTGGITVHFHEYIGAQTVYYVPHDEAYTLPRSFPSLRRAAVRGCFPPHVMKLMGALMQGGLLSNRMVRVVERTSSPLELEIALVDVMRILLADNPISRQNPVWGYGLVVQVKGMRDGRQVTCTYRSHHPPAETWGGEAAYYKNVGIPLSIGAQLIASGAVTACGVCAPEMALPVQPFFDALALRGITIEETIVDQGLLA